MLKKNITVTDYNNLPFCSAVKAGDFLFLSGHAGVKDENGNRYTTVEGQTRQALENVKRTLGAVGATLNDVVKVTVYIKDIRYYKEMNEIYRQYFRDEYPARSTIVTGLVFSSMLLEIECVAYLPQSHSD